MLSNPDRTTPSGPGSRRSSALRAVLVDDSPRARSLLRRVLTSVAGLTVVAEAGDGGEGVQLCALLHPDVVVIDMQMPSMDSFEAIPRIRARSPHTGIVAVSGLESETARAYALRVGADAYVSRSSPIAVMVAAVRGAAAARAPRTDPTQATG